ncbi:hypothetical protein BIZ92_20600 [Achromobacter xylosoxidans]|uniref:Uncharacterized protein n=1 Tax=Alcaligenes xylosoxydans xylosoxydans TaxID=85698 RepID=A0A1R1JXR9_ALCXX|nr:hypothetical protein BIZ92_20600 [Achromobacter xylosoxidans]
MKKGEAAGWGAGRPQLPANLAQLCPPVPEVTSDSWDDFARSYMALAVQYGQCCARHLATVLA